MLGEKGFQFLKDYTLLIITPAPNNSWDQSKAAWRFFPLEGNWGYSSTFFFPPAVLFSHWVKSCEGSIFSLIGTTLLCIRQQPLARLLTCELFRVIRPAVTTDTCQTSRSEQWIASGCHKRRFHRLRLTFWGDAEFCQSKFLKRSNLCFSHHLSLVSWFSPKECREQRLMVTGGAFRPSCSSLFDYTYITTSFRHHYKWMTRCSISAFSTQNRTDDQLGGAYQLWGSLLVSDLCIVNGAEKSASGFPSPHTGPNAAVWLQFKNGAEKVPNALALRGDSVSPLGPLNASYNPDFENRNVCHEHSTQIKPYAHDESCGRWSSSRLKEFASYFENLLSKHLRVQASFMWLLAAFICY